MRSLPAQLLIVALVLVCGVGCSSDGGSPSTGSGSVSGASTAAASAKSTVSPSKSPSKSPSASPSESASAKTSSTYRAQEFRGSAKAFYTPPAPMPKVPHGTLLRYQRLTTTVPGGTAWKVMYASKSLTGKPIGVTGVVIVPKGAAPQGGWKLLSIAHGTTGIADDCAPSAGDVPEQAGRRTTWPVRLTRGDFRRFADAGYLKAGYVLSFTDYEGLGTPGVHPYLVGPSEGRSVLDAARAARQLPKTPVQKRFAIWGYSQGGHSAAWANDLASSWTPDLHLVGTVAGGPVSEMNLVANTLATTDMDPSLLFMIVAGYAAAYPQLHPSDMLTSAGIRVMKKYESRCDAYPEAGSSKPLSTLVKPGFTKNTTWQAVLGRNNPAQYGSAAPKSPLLILHSNDDEVVPIFLSKVMFDRMCTIGWTVERRVYHNGKGHVAEVANAIHDGLPWINARMAGNKPVSTCAESAKQSG